MSLFILWKRCVYLPFLPCFLRRRSKRVRHEDQNAAPEDTECVTRTRNATRSPTVQLWELCKSTISHLADPRGGTFRFSYPGRQASVFLSTCLFVCLSSICLSLEQFVYLSYIEGLYGCQWLFLHRSVFTLYCAAWPQNSMDFNHIWHAYR